jgi:hypothetical protein
LSKIVIGKQFCGPPSSGNGGYVCGVMAEGVDGPATAVLRAPVPLDTPLTLENATLTGEDGALIGQAGPAKTELPDPPPAPSLDAARLAGERHIGLTQRTHPICFTCGTAREEGDGLRVFAGPIEGAPAGYVACTWTPHANFANAEGLIPAEIVWAAIDCPGYFAWVEMEGRHGALLGTMTGEVKRLPQPGEELILQAWPISKDGRKEFAGVALYTADGEVIARAHQVWIVLGPWPASAPPPDPLRAKS